MISVIMGVYNPRNKEIFNKAIQSVLNQTYKDIEVIICDDGSNEETKNFLKEALLKDSRIVLIHNDRNSGLAYSLNHCMAVAKGEYIARMDDDDISHPQRFEEELNFLDAHPEIGWVGCNADLIDGYENIWGHRTMSEYPTKDDLLFNSPFIHPTVLFRRSVLEDANGYAVSRHTRRTEDYDLWMRLYAMGHQGANIQKRLFQYREDEFAYTKRKYTYRIDEAIVRYHGFSQLKLFPKAWLYVVKPLLVGLIPGVVLRKIKKHG